jgi:hypothetical protein
MAPCDRACGAPVSEAWHPSRAGSADPTLVPTQDHVRCEIGPGHASGRCDDVPATAEMLGLMPHFIRPGVTGLVHPLDRGSSVHSRRSIEQSIAWTSPRGMTRADFAAHVIPAWELVPDRRIQRGWECRASDTGAPQARS